MAATTQPLGNRRRPARVSRAPVETAELASSSSPRDFHSADQMLFADGELTGLRSRWTDVQAAFVDDPRDCVQKADSLVADMVDRLTSGFAEARSRLEEQWGRGEQVSTEDLRIALQAVSRLLRTPARGLRRASTGP